MNLGFPLITFPYASRILFAEGIGKVSFAQGIASYFILLAGLGLSLYGIRAVAKVRDNKVELSRLVQELLLISVTSTIIMFIAFVFFTYTSQQLYDERKLYLVLSISVLLGNIGVEWFYQGTEQYKYITIRDIFFKLISLILLFLLVREEKDYIYYAFVLILASSGSALLNFYNLRNYIFFKITLKEINLKRHIKPLLLTFGFSVGTSIYINLDTVLLGYLTSNREVGLYAASLRITKIVVVMVTTLGYVLIPRISYYIENKNFEEFRRVAKISANFTLLLGLPAIAGMFILAEDIIIIFAGVDFLEAVSAFRILLPVILLLGFSNFIGIQILYPYGREKIVLFSVLIGALIHVLFNVILISRYGIIGTAIATLLAESVVLIIQIILSRDILQFLSINKNVYKIIVSTLVMGLILALLPNININIYLELIVNISVGIGTYFLFLALLKEETTSKIIKRGLSYAKRV